MDCTVSVSKGCFVYKNGAKRADKSTKLTTKRKYLETSAVFGKEIVCEPFYKAFLDTWNSFKQKIEELQCASYGRTLEDLVRYIATECGGENFDTHGMSEIVPAAAILTGINQSDHLNQFNALAERVIEKISASVCILNARDCPTLKTAIESMVYNFVEGPFEDDDDRDRKRLRRSQCTIKQLKNWYSNNLEKDFLTKNLNGESQKRRSLVIILPDFECFSPHVLQDFILILSAHYTLLPFVLILGVATSVSTVHSTLPYHVTSKIKLRIFQTQAAPVALNEILERVILSSKYAFHLSGKSLKFLKQIFLYYDFSINGFIQGFKYCLMEHFFQGNVYALCTNYSHSLKNIQPLAHEDIEKLRKMDSFRPYVEKINDCKRIISILTDDDYLKKKLPLFLRDCHLYFLYFRTFLEFLYVLVEDMPKSPLGKQRSELYAFCFTKIVVEEPKYKECLQMLSFMSKEEFLNKFFKAITVTEKYLKEEIEELELGKECANEARAKLKSVKTLLDNIMNATVEKSTLPLTNYSEDKFKNLSSRQDLKDHLIKMSKQEKPTSEFNKLVNETLNYIEKHIIGKYLLPLQQAPPLHEIFVFTDTGSVRRNIIGAPRSALHMALNNPHYYLQCKCCSLSDNTQLLPTLPDLSVVYKLHLECGRMINLFDWLEAFRSVVDYNEEEQINPHVQARFARAVAELQFLGYIKMSKRKTDHATRLTW